MEVVLQNAQMDVQNHVLRIVRKNVEEHARAYVLEVVGGIAFKPVQGVVAVLVLELVLVLHLQKSKKIQ